MGSAVDGPMVDFLEGAAEMTRQKEGPSLHTPLGGGKETPVSMCMQFHRAVYQMTRDFASSVS